MNRQHVVFQCRAGATQTVRQACHLTDAALQLAHGVALRQCLYSSLMGREQSARDGQ
jgi:hypothetical protein